MAISASKIIIGTVTAAVYIAAVIWLYQRTTQPIQNLICQSAIDQSKQVIASGDITFQGNNLFRIKSAVGGTEYFIKGDMDACAIITPRESTPVAPSTEDNSA